MAGYIDSIGQSILYGSALPVELYSQHATIHAPLVPDTPHIGYLFLNRDLARLPVTAVKGMPAIAVPLRVTKAKDERRDFMAAVLGAISLR
jgi:hypothetical protein